MTTSDTSGDVYGVVEYSGMLLLCAIVMSSRWKHFGIGHAFQAEAVLGVCISKPPMGWYDEMHIRTTHANICMYPMLQTLKNSMKWILLQFG